MDSKERRNGKKNPQESANLISLVFFGWAVPIIWKGMRRDLEIEDLYDPLKSDESERLGDGLEREWRKELDALDKKLEFIKNGKKSKPARPSLTWAIVRMFWAQLLVQGLMLFFHCTILRLVQPMLLGWIISYFNQTEDLIHRDQAFLYTGMLVLVTLLIGFVARHVTMASQRVGMCVRVACCSMIYRKVLRLDLTTVNNAAAGQVANLLSNDVARLDNVFVYFHYVWILPIQVVMIGYVMWQSVGIPALVGIGVLLIQTILLQGYLSKLSVKLRSEVAAKTDERVQLMSELISGIEVVKLYAWERAFEAIVSKVRSLEMKIIEYVSYLRAMHQSVPMFSGRVTLYLTLVSFVLLGSPVTAEVSFVLATLLNTMQLIGAMGYSLAITMIGEAAKTMRRLEEFLLLDEVKRPDDAIQTSEKDGLHSPENTTTNSQIEHGVSIKMDKVAANWIYGQLPPTLYEITMEIRSMSLCAVVGPVGSGKSSLLHLLLEELPIGAGNLSILTGENGQTKISNRDIRISYCSQDPWLFAASIRDNILFDQPYDEERYKKVTRVCALLKDFQQLPRGDMSFVGERGTSLSGGQRARVNLARAVYRDAELYLLDDPLSAVDTHVGRHLFDECITGFLKDKTRVLVTHQLQYLPQADTVVVLKRGSVECQGTYDELIEAKIHILDSEESQNREEDGKQIKRKISTLSAIANDDDENRTIEFDAENSEGCTDVKTEDMETQKMSNNVYWQYFSAGANLCSLIFIAIIFVVAQIAAGGTDYWLMYWTNQATMRVTFQLNKSTHSNDTENQPQESNAQGFDEFGLVSPHLAIYVYTFCIFCCVLLILLRNILLMKTFMKASSRIHATVFTNLLQATMRFFNTNPSGRILNRFSKDMGTMDEQLPGVLIVMIQTCSIVVGVLVMIGVVNNWIILPSAIISAVIYAIGIYYVRITHSLKRLEGIAKSPVFSHVAATLDGLTTIRSRGSQAEKLLRREFDRHQDTHTGAWYLIVATANAFGLLLELISTAFIACVCASFILTDDGSVLGGSVGLAISQSLLLTGLVQLGMKQSAEVISEMTSVERILHYMNLPKEGPYVTENPPPQSWPSKGALVIKNVTMRYADNKPPVLKDLNLSINPGSKVGIVGRTGAGKSSLISALFRLTGDGLEGEITLDGIDTKSIGLHELRPRISIIPQEPVLFSASLRYNLDPFEEYSDTDLWNSLREVELSDVVPSLDFRVASGGANFSVGQRQLISLARAILRDNLLIILDEATANVDRQTDVLIQNTIRRKFADCTVLTIAHRLNTVMDSDRVLVMAGGHIVEFDHPHLLLENRGGHFSQMVQQTGDGNVEKLAGIARSAYLLRPNIAPISLVQVNYSMQVSAA